MVTELLDEQPVATSVIVQVKTFVPATRLAVVLGVDEEVTEPAGDHAPVSPTAVEFPLKAAVVEQTV
jgi:hypothetical protein